MKTQPNTINKRIFFAALKATSENRMSLGVLQNKDKILLTIKSDPIMRQRWDRYCKDNHYAKGIDFDEVIGTVVEIVN